MGWLRDLFGGGGYRPRHDGGPKVPPRSGTAVTTPPRVETTVFVAVEGTEQIEYLAKTLRMVEAAQHRIQKSALSVGVLAIHEERLRQLKSYSLVHDDEHRSYELLEAVKALLHPQVFDWPWEDGDIRDKRNVGYTSSEYPDGEPIPWKDLSVSEQRYQLGAAGALIAAEIERLERAEKRVAVEP